MNRDKPKLSTRGTWDVKRRFTLPAMTQEHDAHLVEGRIGALTGVRGARADARHRRVTVIYDITRLYYRQILDELADTGFPVPDTWWSRLKTSWLQGLDETGRGNAHAPASPCCSNPRGIMGSRKRH